MDVLRVLAEAKAKDVQERRERARRKAKQREESQEAAKNRAADHRKGIVAGASYITEEINPFEVMDLAPKREPPWQRGRKPTERMKEFLRKSKVPFTAETTFWEAHLLIGEVQRRRKEGLCTFAQGRLLAQFGYPVEVSFVEASAIIDRIKANGWRRPEEDSAPAETRERVPVAW